jgi:uncharacterized protein YueI
VISDHHQKPGPYQAYRDTQERQHPDHNPAMATATVLHPPSSYPPPPTSYSSAYPQSVSNMISTVDARKNDDMDPLKRQSLPSISEVISGTKPYPPPTSSSTQQPGTSFPSPFTSGASRSFTETEKQPSPQSLRSGSSAYPSRHEATSSFADSPRQPFNGRPGLPPVPDRRPSPATKHEIPPPHHLSDSHSDSRSLNGGYPHPPSLPASAQPVSYPTNQLPPGQLPLPHYPPSPRHAPPSHGYGGHYDQRAPPMAVEDRERGVRHQPEYSNFDTASYQEALSRMAQCSRVTYQFAEAYSRIAHEQHGAHHIPERLPSEQEIIDIIAHTEAVRHSLEYVREVVQQSMRSERVREGAKPKGPYEEEDDVGMYGDSMKTQYALTEVKKRRGRAAPPGRCHSCNRVDTPEWRRGPDGARTLCNACGLHYAKLERKRQIEARSIRPKGDDRK